MRLEDIPQTLELNCASLDANKVGRKEIETRPWLRFGNIEYQDVFVGQYFMKIKMEITKMEFVKQAGLQENLLGINRRKMPRDLLTYFRKTGVDENRC